MKNLAIIPARSGSKGLKDKNIKILNGKHLLAFSIEAALQSKIFDRVIVSTDDQHYADIALEYGAEVPFLRSASLSKDTTTSNEVILDLLDQLEKCGDKYDNFMLLQPTSPLRKSEDIRKAMDLFTKKQANSVISLCEVEHSSLYSGIVPDNLRIDGFIKKDIKPRRQDLLPHFHINGAIYIAKVSYFKRFNDWFESDCYAYLMERKRSIDIDDEFDFRIANEVLTEKFPKLRKIGEKRPDEFYCGHNEQLKLFILGCDPSTKQNKKFETVFNLRKADGQINLRNPYFFNIYCNLLHIFDDVSKNEETDIDKEIANSIYVQNLCKDYLEHETGYYEENWENWINSETVYVDELKQELDKIDPQRKLPVLLTAELLISTLLDKDKNKQILFRTSNYYYNKCDLISHECNKLGRVLIPFSRSPRYDLSHFQKYCERIKRALRI